MSDPLVPPINLNDYTVVEEGSIKKYSCNKCEKLLNTEYTAREHVKVQHFNFLKYKCPLCDEKFKHDYLQVKHLAVKHGMEEIKVGETKSIRKVKKCICEECKRVYPSRSSLKMHMKRHKLHECPDCSLKFTREELGIHKIEVHGNAMPTCGVCGYQHVNKMRVESHQRQVHLKEKNVQCPQCDMKFYSVKYMTRHLVTHNPVKNLECPYCQKKFPRMNALREHKKIHTGDKRKICPICDERFVQKASLNYHMAKHHPEAC